MADRDHKPEFHSVEKGELRRTSPSQIHSWDLCGLRWWFDKVARLPRKPKTKSQDVGTATHKQLEHYLKTGEDVLGPIARAGKHLLPDPGPDLMLEWDIHFQPEAATDPKDPRRNEPRLTICGVPMIGYIDVVNPRFATCRRGLVEVLDHKTTSSIADWSKTSEELRQDAQCVSYCEWARVRFPEAEEFLFSHVYYQTKGRPRSIRVDVTHTKASLLEAWHLTENKIEGMRAAARETDPKNVAHNPEACSAYGGCDYAGACPFSPARRFAQTFSDALKKGSTSTMSLADRLKGAKTAPAPAAAPATPPPAAVQNFPKPAATAPAAPPAPPPPPPASVQTGGAAAPEGSILVSACVQGATYLIPANPSLEGRASDVVSTFAGKAGVWALFRDEAKNLTRAKLDEHVIPMDTSDAPAETAPATPPPAVPAAAILPPDAPKSDPAKASVPAPAATPAPAVAPPEAAKPKRGRPPKAAATTPPPATPATTGTEPAAQQASEPGDLVLFVNCIPSSPYTDLTGYVQQIAADVAKTASIEDVRVAEGQSPLAFGKWTGYVAAHAKNNPPSGQCVIFSSQLSDPMIEALSGIAAEVVRGVR